MKYQTYEVSINAGSGLKFFEIVACDMQAAHADIRAAYGDDVEIVCTRVL
jgi:hypothetical protein